ncbi:MAG: helix-turn-helix transcriptional regulator [Deltaproteobacteria bacterium]|nr:helix-turn-helix transcriptional regulator [Deltaproteobacteria bacterium]
MKDPIPEEFPDRIRRLRVKHGLTQTRMAELMEVFFASINRWENGQSRPSPWHGSRYYGPKGLASPAWRKNRPGPKSPQNILQVMKLHELHEIPRQPSTFYRTQRSSA